MENLFKKLENAATELREDELCELKFIADKERMTDSDTSRKGTPQISSNKFYAVKEGLHDFCCKWRITEQS